MNLKIEENKKELLKGAMELKEIVNRTCDMKCNVKDKVEKLVG